MGTGWAVGAAATMGLSVALLLAGGGEPRLPILLVPFVFGAWAYGVSMASHGSRGALAALAGHAALAVAFALARGATCWRTQACGPLDRGLLVLLALVGALALAATVAEARRRRGPVQWGTAAFLLAPLALTVLAIFARALA